MKLNLLVTFFIVLFFSTSASALDVRFAESVWDGVKIPEGQQCQKFGGHNPSTPTFIVTGVPAGSNAIVLEYSDRDSKKMNNGGHGRMSFAFDSTVDNVKIPSVPGHSFDLPPQFKMIEAHRGAGWDIDGAYMPPVQEVKVTLTT